MESTSIKTRRQYWRRTAAPKPWWPWGIAPLAGLAILFLIGALLTAPRIEAEVREQVSDTLDAAGLPTFEVRSDGQGVTISTSAQGEEELYLRSVAATTQCQTWAGDLDCPTSVTVRQVENRDAPAVLSSRPHPFTLERIDGSVRLSGEVPSIEEQDRILGVAGQHFEDVTNSMSVTNESAGSNYGRAADQALAVMSHLTAGTASWSGSALTVDGSANADAVAKAREQFAALGSESMQGEFSVRSLLGSQRCNTDFDELLSNATIRFQTSSAVIDAGNDALLNQLADLAISCPGTLVIEGHTDNRGDAAANQALSLARANAVRDALASRGIEANRLAAKGLGEAQPIANNDTSTGRAKNRRIAITIGETQ